MRRGRLCSVVHILHRTQLLPTPPLRCARRHNLYTPHLSASRLRFLSVLQREATETPVDASPSQAGDVTTHATTAVSSASPRPSQQNAVPSSRVDDNARRDAITRRRHPPPSSAATDDYEFPVGRALRFLKLSQRLPQRQMEDREEVQELLEKLSGELSTANADREVKAPQGASVTAAVEFHTESAEEGEETAEEAEVSAFVKYHAHHVLAEFKKLRRTLFQSPQHGNNDDRRGRNSRRAGDAAAGDDAASTLTPQQRNKLAQFLFSATVVLHLGGCYSVGDTHVERLVETCFSITIFLAQDASARARHASAASATVKGSSTTHHRGRKKAPPLSPSPTSHLSQRYAHSLHWSIVHFAAAARSWGLLAHTSPLQNLRRTQLPYQRLLQVHAALLCELARKDVDPVLWRTLVQLKAGPLAPPAQAAWFLNADVATYNSFFAQGARGGADDCVPSYLQQRRLQLLPMLWLSLLCAQLQRRESALCEADKVRISSTAPSARGKRGDAREAQALEDSGQEVGWSAARHAFTSLLPLFALEARLEETAWALLHLLMLPRRVSRDGGVSESASLTEACALVARLEQSGAALHLGAALPLAAPERSAADAADRTSAHLALFLRRYLDANSLTGVARDGVGDAAQVRAQKRKLKARGQVMTAASAAIARLGVPHTSIHRPAQLYRALLNVPRCALRMPSPAFDLSVGSPSHGHASSPPVSLPLPITAEGVRLVNALLLRVLMQWRPGTQQQQHTASIPAGSSPPLPQDGRSKKARAESLASKGGEPNCTAAAAEAWETDLLALLQAAHHLHRLLLDATQWSSTEREGQSTATDDNASLQLSLLTHTLQAAARALCEQLGAVYFPRRLALKLSSCGGQPLTQTELQLLRALDAELRHVLLHAPPDRVEGTTEFPAGALPQSYQRTFFDLTR